jgi:hypothetical protein
VNGLRTKTTTGVITVNGNQIEIQRWLKPAGIMDGTTLINFTSGKYYKSDSATHIIGNSVTFCGPVTWDTTIRWGRTAGRIFKWASGTITMPTPSYLNFSGSGTINWPATAPQLQRIGASAASTIVMSQSVALGISLANAASLTWAGAYNLTIPNCYACNSLAGTATLKFQGSNCNWSRSATSVHAMGVIMNCSTLTIDNGVSWGAAGQTLRYVAGNVIPKEKGSFNIFPQTPKLNNGPVVFYNLNVGSTASPVTITLLSNLNVSGVLSVTRDRTINFTGPFNVEVGNLSIPNPSSTIAYGFAIAAGRTLKINTAISAGGYSNTFPNVFKFSSGTTNSKAYINYRGTMQNMELAGTGFKDIESTNGRLATWFGTLTATTNIDSLNPFNFYNLYGVI